MYFQHKWSPLSYKWKKNKRLEPECVPKARDVFSHSKTRCFKTPFRASSIFFFRQKPDIAVRLSAALRFFGFHAQWLLGALALKAISAPSGVKLAWIYKSFKVESWICSLNKGYVLDETLLQPSRAANSAGWCLSKRWGTWKLHSPRICYSNAAENSQIDESLVKNESIHCIFWNI